MLSRPKTARSCQRNLTTAAHGRSVSTIAHIQLSSLLIALRHSADHTSLNASEPPTPSSLLERKRLGKPIVHYCIFPCKAINAHASEPYSSLRFGKVYAQVSLISSSYTPSESRIVDNFASLLTFEATHALRATQPPYPVHPRGPLGYCTSCHRVRLLSALLHSDIRSLMALGATHLARDRHAPCPLGSRGLSQRTMQIHRSRSQVLRPWMSVLSRTRLRLRSTLINGTSDALIHLAKMTPSTPTSECAVCRCRPSLCKPTITDHSSDPSKIIRPFGMPLPAPEARQGAKPKRSSSSISMMR